MMERELERRAPKPLDDAARRALVASRGRWRVITLWLTGIAIVVGTTLRRPLGGDYGVVDLAWASLYGAIGVALAQVYRIWQRRAEAESTRLLARVSGDTLRVFPGPGREQRVPLIGVSELVRGEIGEHDIELKTVQPAAMGGSYRVSLTSEEVDEVIAFVNALLAEHRWHEL